MAVKGGKCIAANTFTDCLPHLLEEPRPNVRLSSHRMRNRRSAERAGMAVASRGRLQAGSTAAAACLSSKYYFGTSGAVNKPYVTFGGCAIVKFPLVSCGNIEIAPESNSMAVGKLPADKSFHSHASVQCFRTKH